MARVGAVKGKLITVGAVLAMLVLALWMTPMRQMSSAQDRPNSRPLIARGYTDATAGTVIVAGDPSGGQTVIELRIKDGQKVKRDEVIAVLSNYPTSDTLVRIAEANLEKLKQARQSMLTGPRAMQIAIDEQAIQTTIDDRKLQALMRQRSGRPPEEKALEVSISDRGFENQKTSLELAKKSLATDLELNQIDIANSEAKVESAKADREAALVRSPVDGQVVEIYTRQGEMIPGHPGIAKIVDMRQMRVLAEVDELHLPRLVPGAPVEVTFRGSPQVYKGKVVRSPMTVTRVKRSKADLGEGSAHVVEAEIEFDDPSSIPQMLEREARVIFL
jgi:multidrug resistance efflux pump